MLREKSFKIIGWILIVIGLFFNPFVVEWLFSPDGKLDFLWKYISIGVFDGITILIGLIALKMSFKRRRKTNLTKTVEQGTKTLSQNYVKNIFVLIVTIIIVLAIMEVTFYFMNKQNEIKKESILSEKFVEFNPLLGYWGVPNISTNRIKFFENNSIIYDVVYSLDQHGRRKNSHEDGESLILFGGSFTFGSGLENNETISYYLSAFTNYDVFNYGFPGYGTQHMLANLEREDFYSEINKTGGKAVYLFIPDHIRRITGDMSKSSRAGLWIKSPYYYLDKNEDIKRKGNFETGRPLKTKFYRILSKSNILKYSKINLPIRNEKHTLLAFKAIDKSKKLYEERFNGSFYVLIYPGFSNQDESIELKKLLRENNIPVLEYNFMNKYNYEDLLIHPEGDRHPNNKMNKELAAEIAKSIT